MARITSHFHGSAENASTSAMVKRPFWANERALGCTNGICRKDHFPALTTRWSGTPSQRTEEAHDWSCRTRRRAQLRTSALTRYAGCSRAWSGTTKGARVYWIGVPSGSRIYVSLEFHTASVK